MSITSSWRHWLLLCLCCHFEIQPAACAPAWMRRQFPCDVTGHNASKVIFNCRGRHLQSVPRGITSNATEVNLSENNIKKISVNAFSHLVNLTLLSLSWANKKEGLTICADVFKNLTKLHKLKLSGNRLDKVPRNLPAGLDILELNNNNIHLLHGGSFAGLRNLTKLFLSKNCFVWNPCGISVNITEDSFKVMTKLQDLDLSFNNLTHVPKGLPQSLLMLKLASNQIQYISENDFHELHYLKILKIEGNCPRCQNAPFPCVPCRNLSSSDPSSLGIHPNAFRNLKNLEELNLGGNSLTHLNSSLFESLRNLKHLFLSFNFLQKTITEEAGFLRYLSHLETIDISFNFALKYYPKTLNLSDDFSKLVSLKTLHLEALVFQQIGPSSLKPLYNLKNLSMLNLGTNFIIQYDSTIFSHFSHLKIINLAENRLYPIPVARPPPLGDGYNQRSGFSFSMSVKPHTKEYGGAYFLIKKACLNSGRVLSLNSNNLFFISLKQFEDYGNIACLNLSGNGFSAALNGTEFSLLPNLTYLDLSVNKIDLAYDNAFIELQKLQVLDLSYNAHYFQAYGVTHNLNFIKNLPVLRVLNMSHNAISTLTTKQMHSSSLTELQFKNNYLGILWKERDSSYETLFSNLTNLTILDISQNNIVKIPENVYKFLPRKLTTLRISHNSLTDFKWDKLEGFHQLRILDLSFNSLSNMMGMNLNTMHNLTFLDLSNNRIFHLDDGFLKGARSLETLSLSYNKLTVINQSTFDSGPETHLKTLLLWRNPLQCTCDSLYFILWIEKSHIKIPRLTYDVTCGTPENQKGQALIYFDINQCENDDEAFKIWILTSFIIIVFMFVATLAHLFFWEASYVLHFLKAKLKGYSSLNSPDSAYDVFVTYDTKDPHVSEWVMKNLRVKLEEEGEKHLPLCLEERDWPPGVPLVDNLTQSIRYSRKTLFVLTKAYVKTGVFKLSMYLAHQRLLDENVDVIVLLMLEPVLQHSHFLRLRRRLCEKSIVEWPRTAAAESCFWQNLRNVIRVDNQVMYNKTYSKYFTMGWSTQDTDQ